MSRSVEKRLEALEARRAAWAAAHVPISEVSGFLLAVLTVVQKETGQATFQQVAGKLIGQKLRRIEALRGRA